ncbi:MAG TPA: TonB-dependent receptor [Myxococcales bacterium]|nr:TonB-dependent receptor [Myxococcales bacterium]
MLALLLCAPPVARAQQPAPPQALPSEPGGTAGQVGTTNAPGVAEEPAQRRAGEEEIIVTGSRVRRKDLTTPAPVTVFTRQQLEESGRVTLGEFLQLMPEQGNAPNFQLNNGGSTYDADGSTQVNLRNLGVQRTLVLVNGRRVVPTGVGASPAVDLNTIPIAAVENVEVLKDGASAIYGSDAIAGVVNIITRKSYNATQVGATYGVSQRGDAETFDAALTTGSSGTAGNFMFSAGYFKQGTSWLKDRDWSSSPLSYDFQSGKVTSGGSFRTPQGSIGLPADAKGNALPACMSNATCAALVNSDPTWASDAFIRCDPGTPGCTIIDKFGSGWRLMADNDRYNFSQANYLTIPSQRISAYAAGDTRFGGGPVRGYFEASYVSRTSSQNAAPMPLNPPDYSLPGSNTPIEVSAQSYYNPFGVALPFSGRRLVEFGNRGYSEELGTFRVVTGVDGSLPESTGPLNGWYWDVSVNYGRTDGSYTTSGAIRNSKIADAVGPSFKLPSGQVVCGNPGPDNTPGTPDDVIIPSCVPINLFGGPNNGSIDPSQINNLGFSGTSRAFDQLFAVNANTTGELFTLAADRPVALAVGYEYRIQAGSQIADPIAASFDSADFNFQTTSGHYYSNEAYAELSVPLLADKPFVRTFEASAAGRYVNYSTFGGKFTYKFGGRYKPVDDLTLRGTYSTAFRAPSIHELYLGAHETAPTASDPCGDLSAASPALKAQCTAPPTGNVGATNPAGSGDTSNQVLLHQVGNTALQPETADTWTLGLVLQPRVVPNLSFTLDYYDIHVDNTIFARTAPQILAGCYPASLNISAAPNANDCAAINRAPSGRILFVTTPNLNLGSSSTSGIDFAIHYALPTEFGRFGLGFDVTYLKDYTQQGQSVVGTYNLAYPLPKWKGNLGLSWRIGGWSTAALVRYVGTFKECDGGVCDENGEIAGRQVGHYTQLDLNANYTLRTSFGRTLFMVGMNNVFDQQPQFVYSAALANSDPSIYDFVGRYVYFRAQHTF